MNMKNIYSLGAIVLVVALLWFFGSVNRTNPKTTSNLPKSDLASPLVAGENLFFDFGNISMGAGNVSHVFKIVNTNKTAIVVSKIYTSCMCTVATLVTKAGRAGPFGMPGHATIASINQSIAPGEEASVEAVFDPAAHGPSGTGRVRRIIYLETDAQKEPFELSFEANVTP
ncbi:MAG: DUF1573 domain-containing protein [Patescibacteria group bacterium]